jgi:hypothetical protein
MGTKYLCDGFLDSPRWLHAIPIQSSENTKALSSESWLSEVGDDLKIACLVLGNSFCVCKQGYMERSPSEINYFFFSCK